MNTVPCPHCHLRVTPEPPRSSWRVLNVGLWVSMLVLTPLFCGLTGPNILLAPMLLGMATSIGASARLADEWHCPICFNQVAAPHPEEAGHPARPIGIPQYA